MNTILVGFMCIIGLLFTSCSEKCPAGEAGYALIQSYAKKIKETEHWYCDGVGGGFDYDRIRVLGTGFEIDNPEVSVDEARVFFVKALEGFLDEINNDLKARPYLVHYPFTCDDVRFGISFPFNSPLFISDVNVASVTIINGKIYYDSYNKATGKLIDLYEEDYSEALKIVKETQTFSSEHPQSLCFSHP